MYSGAEIAAVCREAGMAAMHEDVHATQVRPPTEHPKVKGGEGSHGKRHAG